MNHENFKKDELQEVLNKKDNENQVINIDMSDNQIRVNAPDIWKAAIEIVKRLFF